jgi:hypothetical protein
MGSRVADAPVRSTVVAVNNDSRGVDLPIIMASVVGLCTDKNEGQLERQKVLMGWKAMIVPFVPSKISGRWSMFGGRDTDG